MPWRKIEKAERSPWKLLLWTAVAGLIFGLIGFGELAEDWLRVGRNALHKHKASGDIVFVAVDDTSLRQVGRWPWPRRYHAQIADELTAAGARGIFFDILFETRSTPSDDRMLADSIARSGRVTLAVTPRSGLDAGNERQSLPLASLRERSRLASISVNYNYQNAAWRIPYGSKVDNRVVPSFAAGLAGKRDVSLSTFTPDYSIDPASIPRISASSVLKGRLAASAVAGKFVVVGTDSELIGDQYFIPGYGKMGGAYIHIISAETLKAGTPRNLGWVAGLLFALIVATASAFHRRRLWQNLILGGGAACLLVVPVFTEARLIFIDVTPGLFAILLVASVLAWRRFRSSGLVNAVSGLPNLSALRADRTGRDQALVVARVLNYAEIVATLPPEQERKLGEQIIARLRVGAPERTLYQGDGGIFAWFEEARVPFGNHIEALYALFRNPARVDGQTVDLSISFGVEIGSSRSLANRLGSALLAAEEAAHDGLKWKYHDPETLQDASWKLSMLSQLDSAVDKGEVWVAYQPQLDLHSRKIIGAEALARWTHPEKGPIAASEFVAAAEQHDRIGKLTDFVLDHAIEAAALVNRKQPGFGMAVNLSARLLNDRGLVLRLRAMLARHGLAPELLTLELTETAALAGTGPAIDMLAALRELGVKIAIDDYGTGLSTLDYLKRIPASEIKIDQSFVKSMLDNRSDRVMVQSTIALAHSLGRNVVAEGVEDQAVLDTLIEMKCDVAQGYIIGRPMSIERLIRRVTGVRGSRVA